MTVILGIVFFLIMVGLLAVPSAWALMLLLGALHHLTGWPTAIGFWACYIITLLLAFFIRRNNVE